TLQRRSPGRPRAIPRAPVGPARSGEPRPSRQPRPGNPGSATPGPATILASPGPPYRPGKSTRAACPAPPPRRPPIAGPRSATEAPWKSRQQLDGKHRRDDQDQQPVQVLERRPVGPEAEHAASQVEPGAHAQDPAGIDPGRPGRMPATP